jgi:hypothetical protein
VTLEFTDEEDESREGSGINRENDSNEKNKSREGSRIDRENNSKSENN